MKRPFQVTVLGWLFIVVGILSTTYHLLKSPPEHPYKKYESHPFWSRIDKGSRTSLKIKIWWNEKHAHARSGVD